MSLPAESFPLRAVGSNVLLRTVKEDSRVLLLEMKDKGVMRFGEVVGLGSYWTMDLPWFPPIPQQSRARSEELEREQRRRIGQFGVSDWKPMIMTPDSLTRRKPMGVYTVGHALRAGDVKAGDLVVYNNARVYDTFRHEEDDILVYPGIWLEGVVTDTHLDNPRVRRFARAEL
jgi:hypothetical protein